MCRNNFKCINSTHRVEVHLLQLLYEGRGIEEGKPKNLKTWKNRKKLVAAPGVTRCNMSAYLFVPSCVTDPEVLESEATLAHPFAILTAPSG
jgi:hypothetical protein